MKRITLLLILIFPAALATTSYAQMPDKRSYEDRKKNEKTANQDSTDRKKIWDKITFGGNAWASFGSVTYVELMPLVGYRVTPELQVGAGPSFIFRNYINLLYSSGGYDVVGPRNNSIWGGRVYAHYNVYKDFFVRGEFEALSTPFLKPDALNINFIQNRRFVLAPLIGGGYRQQLGERAAAYIIIMYDLNYDARFSYSPSPLRMNVGFMF